MQDVRAYRTTLAQVATLALTLVGACGRSASLTPATAQAPVVQLRIPAAESRPLPEKRELGCPYGALYALTDQHELFAFDRERTALRKVGTLDCADIPLNSMTMETDGTIWLSAHNGGLYRTTAEELRCGRDLSQGTLLHRTSAGLFRASGTFWVSSMREGGDDSAGLFRVLLTAFEPDDDDIDVRVGLHQERVGSFTDGLAHNDAELTMDATGTLVGLFNTAPLTLARIDTRTGATPLEGQRTIKLPISERVSAWTVSYWDGVYWVFAADSKRRSMLVSVPQDVFKQSGPEARVTQVSADLGHYVIGSGRGPCVGAGSFTLR